MGISSNGLGVPIGTPMYTNTLSSQSTAQNNTTTVGYNNGFNTSRYSVESNEKWRELSDLIPFIYLRLGYKIKITPPFNGAIIRFQIQSPTLQEYSIYWDAYDNLGSFGAPYYEVYPIKDESTYRSLDINDILMKIYEDSEGIEVIKQDYPEFYI